MSRRGSTRLTSPPLRSCRRDLRRRERARAACASATRSSLGVAEELASSSSAGAVHAASSLTSAAGTRASQVSRRRTIIVSASCRAGPLSFAILSTGYAFSKSNIAARRLSNTSSACFGRQAMPSCCGVAPAARRRATSRIPLAPSFTSVVIPLSSRTRITSISVVSSRTPRGLWIRFVSPSASTSASHAFRRTSLSAASSACSSARIAAGPLSLGGLVASATGGTTLFALRARRSTATIAAS